MKKLSEAIKKGEAVICPTDTVYGLIADAFNPEAVEKIFEIKKRPRTKPLAVFVSDIKEAKELAEINKEQEEILKKHWPGKYTFILKCKKKNIPELLTKDNNIGIRIPNYPLLIDLIKELGRPLAQTSANISGEKPKTRIKEVVKQFPGVPFIDKGDLPDSKPSKVVDLTKKGEVIRD